MAEAAPTALSTTTNNQRKRLVNMARRKPEADSTEEESVHSNSSNDATMEDTDSVDGEKSSEEARAQGKSEPPPKLIPFMDTFYQLSSEESPRERSVAARHLIQHCLLSEQGVNTKDSAYALERLMKGLCTGRAASRQGFASCLASFLKVMHSLDETTIDSILKEDGGDEHGEPAMAIRTKLLAITQYHQSAEKEGGAGKNKKNRFGGKFKGIEERDHVFGRLFGILAVVRSGILTADDSSLSVSRCAEVFTEKNECAMIDELP